MNLVYQCNQFTAQGSCFFLCFCYILKYNQFVLYIRGMNRIFESESDQDDNDGSNEETRGKRTRAPLALPTAPTIGPPAVTSSEQPRGNHTRAQLALPAAPTIVPPAVITPAILPPTPSRPELSPSSFQNAATPRVPRVNDQLMCERKSFAVVIGPVLVVLTYSCMDGQLAVGL